MHHQYQADCRELILEDLGTPDRHGAEYAAWKCPFHHERQGFSLVAYETQWRCFGKCNTGGDCVSWLMQYRGMSFVAASRWLRNATPLSSANSKRNYSHSSSAAPADPPDSLWQTHAMALIEIAEHTLWSDTGRRALHYLTDGERKLTTDTVRAARLGFVPGHFEQWKAVAPGWVYADGERTLPVMIPCGIVIPHIVDGAIWAVRVRRAAVTERNAKYQAVRGGKKTLYWADETAWQHPMMVLEGEFDCLAIWQCAGDLISAVAIGSAANKNINRRWWMKLVGAPQIFARMDADSAGQQALATLQQLSRRVRSVQVPRYKDVNDLLRFEGCETVRQWVVSFLSA